MYGMCNELYLQHNINTIFKVYRGGLWKLYNPITVCGMMLSPYVYHNKVDITCS